MAEPLFHLQQLRKCRTSGSSAFCLEVADLTIERGERLVLTGASGCGKSTLLDILAMVLRVDSAAACTFHPPAQGSYDLMQLWQQGALDVFTTLRRRYFGYVLQSGGLLGFLSVRDNIGLLRRWRQLPANVGVVEQLAERLNIAHLLNRYPSALSMGERQRVAIARALAHAPPIVLADEPTASLDPLNADAVMELFLTLASEQGVTLIMASHDWPRMERYGLSRLAPELTQRQGNQVTVRFGRVPP